MPATSTGALRSEVFGDHHGDNSWLSGVMKISPDPEAGDIGKKRVGLVVAGIPKAADVILVSAKSVRKSWDDASIGSVNSLELEGKQKAGGKSKVTRGAILRTRCI